MGYVMIVENGKYITREYIRQHPNWIFVFGDNVQHKGYGGQAKECRGEPNCIGIPTKWSPDTHPASYFYDYQFEQVKPLIDKAFEIIEYRMQQGYTIVFLPRIGMGHAQLQKHAPRILKYIHNKINELWQKSEPFVLLADTE